MCPRGYGPDGLTNAERNSMSNEDYDIHRKMLGRMTTGGGGCCGCIVSIIGLVTLFVLTIMLIL